MLDLFSIPKVLLRVLKSIPKVLFSIPKVLFRFYKSLVIALIQVNYGG